MLKSFIPHEGRFFDLFQASADEITSGMDAFRKMLNDLPNRERYAKTIEDHEHKADEITHTTVELLHKTFITPLDRDHIHELITRLDDILDLINAAAQRINLYEVTEVPKEVLELADVCFKSTELIQKSVNGLSDLKRPAELMKACVELNRFENEADQILRVAVAKLFREETDFKSLIKNKEICELLESVTDRCEDVANIIEGIVLEYA